MIYADEESCKAAGVDPMKVESIARRLDKLGREAEKMGLFIFGGSGSGTLRTQESYNNRNIVVASFGSGGEWDGGDGATTTIDGVMYGE